MLENNNNQKLTPLMQQYFNIRETYNDQLLMFQVGDFYELFFDDAKKASACLGIALTKRGTFDGKPIPLCGVPVHTLDHHLAKLVRAGFKVAVCNQLHEAVPGKFVERGVTQVFTPGTITDSRLLDEKSASYLFSFFPTENSMGLLFGELLTAQLFATVLPSGNNKLLESEIGRFFPDEILMPNNKLGKSFQSFFKAMGYFTTLELLDLENQDYTKNLDNWVSGQFDKNVVENLNSNKSLLYALYNFYNYVNKNQVGAIEHFRALHFYEPDDFLILDPSCQKNLELLKNNQDGGRKNTLFSIMDKACTSMGSRMVKKWISRPLVKKEPIEQRLDAVQVLLKDVTLAQKVKEILVQIGDVERIVGRVALRRATVSDYIALSQALMIVPDLKEVLVNCENILLLKVIISYLGDFNKIYNLLVASINTDQSKDWIIKTGFDQKLDNLRELVFDSNNKILQLEEKEKRETGIQSLKVGYNRVSGYYIEITKTNLHLVPAHYTRESTLSNRERYTCRELRDMQDEIIRAKSQITQVETEVFETIKREVYSCVVDLRKLASALANLDALLSFSSLAYDYGYVRPVFGASESICDSISDNIVSGDIFIEAGRHPVVEICENVNFIPNDVILNSEQSLWIITGPNMGGKSTFLRQAALICIMAQCGSFVPAKSANLSILDRVFTRIGSGDNLAGGKSTFLVEMEETALICKQATKNSLVILDEVGRGTSTYDGFAIAKAVVEYIHTKIGAKCLFATHYHELNALGETFPAIASYHAASKNIKMG
jgi:DNA mismatch repair protein MutS